jgi:UDP-glucose 4-epimerase
MRVCVVGGSGFLGSHVADELTACGHEVHIYDRARSKWLQPTQTMFVGDLLDFDSLLDATQGCDVIYNFAALADLNLALDRPIETIKINILGNANVLEVARINKIKRFIFASTVYVYSRKGGFYRCSKQSAEHYVEEYKEIYDIDFTILRFGSLYGPRSDESNGLYRIVKNLLETGKLRYQGSPDAMRDYIHVGDAARASVKVLEQEFRNQSIVLSGQQPMRVLDLLEMLSEIAGLKSKVDFVEADQPGHYVRTPYAYMPKIGRKYIPTTHVDLGQGLLELIDNIRMLDN